MIFTLLMSETWLNSIPSKYFRPYILVEFPLPHISLLRESSQLFSGVYVLFLPNVSYILA